MCDSVVKQIISTSKKLDHCWIGSEYLKQRMTEKVYNCLHTDFVCVMFQEC